MFTAPDLPPAHCQLCQFTSELDPGCDGSGFVAGFVYSQWSESLFEHTACAGTGVKHHEAHVDCVNATRPPWRWLREAPKATLLAFEAPAILKLAPPLDEDVLRAS